MYGVMAALRADCWGVWWHGTLYQCRAMACVECIGAQMLLTQKAWTTTLAVRQAAIGKLYAGSLRQT
jgi:hypothetical protein